MPRPSDYQRIKTEKIDIEYEGLVDRLSDWIKRVGYFARYRLPWGIRSLKHIVQRAVRGYSDLDLSLHTDRFIETAIRAARYHRDKSLTFPISYSDNGFELDSPDRGRGLEGYREDLSEIILGFEHWKAADSLNEGCSCCGDYCQPGCPMIVEAKSLYFKLIDFMSE